MIFYEFKEKKYKLVKSNMKYIVGEDNKKDETFDWRLDPVNFEHASASLLILVTAWRLLACGGHRME